jgi:hypothetical protein
VLLGYTLLSFALHGTPLSLPLAGCGIIFVASAFMLLCSGVLGELVYNLGDMRDYEFARLTQRLRTRIVPVETKAQ